MGGRWQRKTGVEKLKVNAWRRQSNGEREVKANRQNDIHRERKKEWESNWREGGNKEGRERRKEGKEEREKGGKERRKEGKEWKE